MPQAAANEPSSFSTTSNGVTTQHTNNSLILSSSPSSKSPAVAFAESPQIAEILHKVDVVQASVTDLQEQLASASATASASAVTRQLQEELDQQRTRKQAEDATRTEIRTRTRALEDSKRHAESSKREVEKRLKTAQSVAANSERRTTTLSAETTSLRTGTEEHLDRAERTRVDADALCTELKEEVEGRKGEVKEVEDVLTALVRRVKELEAKVADEEERLRQACDEAEERKHAEQLDDSLDASTFEEARIWPIKSPHDAKPQVPSSIAPVPSTPALDDGLNGFGKFATPTIEPVSIGYFPQQTVPPQRSDGIPVASFAPFSPVSEQLNDNPISPLSSSFIPSSLIESLGLRSPAPTLYPHSAANVPHSPLSPVHHEQCSSPMSRSFQSDDDVILDRRESASFNGFGLAPGSGAPSAFVPTPASLSPASPSRTIAGEQGDFKSLDAFSGNSTNLDSIAVKHQPAGTKRLGWFAKDRKGHSASVGGGLNPDAKEFSLPKDRTRTLSFLHSKPRSATVGNVNGTSPSFDSKAHTPDSSGSSSSFTPSFEDGTSSLSSFSSPAASIRSTASSALSSALPTKFTGLSGVSGLGSAWFGASQSAFAPTPTEREVLIKAFAGGSTSNNASLDQLPSFSSSASTSPQPLPAVPSANKELRSPGLISRPTWLGSLRNGRTGSSKSSSFCPFDDNEPFAK